MRQPIIASAVALVLACLIFDSAVAYETYTSCGASSCHGAFKEGEYVSKVDGAAWNDHLMGGHEDFITGNDGCDACR